MVNYARNVLSDVKVAGRSFAGDRSALLVTDLALLPWLATIIVHRDLNVWIPLTEIFGIIATYWFFTRKDALVFLPVRTPMVETAVVLIFVLVWMLFRIGQYANLFSMLSPSSGVCDDLIDTIIPKMLEMVVLPLLVFLAWKYRPRDLGLNVPRREWLPALIPLAVLIWWGLSIHSPQVLFSRSACFYFGAGLPEEFLFRALLLTRVQALVKNPPWALFFSSVIFGASHLPIDLHGVTAQNWQSAFETAFTFQMGIGLALGYAFQRTRSLLPLTFIHTLIDAAP